MSFLGLNLLHSILLKHKIDAKIVSPFTGNRSKSVKKELPAYMRYLKPFLNSDEIGPTAGFSTYSQLGTDHNILAAEIAALHPEIILVSSFAFAYADDAINLSKELRTLLPTVKIIAGGAGVCAYPEYYLQMGEFDAVFTGEAEDILSLFDNMSHPIIEGKKNCQPEAIITRIPIKKKQFKLNTILSRGCPKRCSFCSNYMTQGRTFRKVKLDDLETQLHIQRLWLDENNMNCSHFNIEDDNLLIDRAFFFDTISLIRKYFPNSILSAENGLDYMLLRDEDLTFLAQNNFKQLNLSLSTATLSQLEKLERGGNPDRLKAIAQKARKLDLFPIIYFICGLKNDTEEQVITNLLYLAETKALSGISLFYPVPGLPGFTDKTLFNPMESHKTAGSAAWPWSKSLSTSQMLTAFRLSRILNLSISNRRSEIDEALLNAMRIKGTILSYKKTDKNTFFSPAGMDQSLICRFFNYKPL